MGRPAGWIGAGLGVGIAVAVAGAAGARWLLRELNDLSAGQLVHGEGALLADADSYGAEASVAVRLSGGSAAAA
jgi:hypothetical protein